MIKHHRVALLGLLLISVLVYGQAFLFEYINYDDPFYLEKDFIVDGFQLTDIKRLFKETGTNLWHPITWLSFYLDKWFASSTVSHGINIIFHAFNSCLLFLLLSKIPKVATTAFFVALIHAIHPLHIESVAWVSARKDVLSLFFILLSLLCYVNTSNRNKAYLLGTFVFFLMALMCKPIAVITPIFMLAITLGSKKEARGIREKLTITAFTILSFIFCIFTLWIHRESPNAELILNASALDKTALIGFNYLHYLYQFFLPNNLSFFYPHEGSLPLHIYIGYSTAVLTLLALIGLRFKNWQMLSMLWLLYVLSYAPVAGFITIGDAIRADRYMYIPAIFIALLGIELVTILSSLFNKRFKSSLHITVGIWMGLIVVVGQVYLKKWTSNQSLFSHALELNPHNYLAYHNLAISQADLGQPDLALTNYQKVLKIKPTYKSVRYRIAQIYQQQGKFSIAEKWLQEEHQLYPSNETLLALAYNLYLDTRFEECVSFITKLQNKSSELLLLKALSLHKLKNYTDAVKLYAIIPSTYFSDSDKLSFAYSLLATNNPLEAKNVLLTIKDKSNKGYQRLLQMISRSD